MSGARGWRRPGRPAEQLRRAQKRSGRERCEDSGSTATPAPRRHGQHGAPGLNRRAVLTPAEEEEFDRIDPWPAAWSSPGCRSTRSIRSNPMSTASRDGAWWWPGRRASCWSGPGYSEGGVKSRDWKSVALGTGGRPDSTADLDRHRVTRVPARPTRSRWVDWPRGLERPLVRLVGADRAAAASRPVVHRICNPVQCRHASQELRGDELLGGPDPGGGGRVVDHADRQGQLPRGHQVRRLPGAVGISRNILSDRLDHLVERGS